MTKSFLFSPNKRALALRLAMPGLFLAASFAAAAQLYIGTGAQVQLTGNAGLMLQGMDLVNNGTFSAGNSTVYFSGAGNSSVGGTKPIQFYAIHINKGPGSSLVFQRPVGLSNEVRFTQGFIDLNGQDLDLGSTGRLVGESANSRIIGAAGGEVLFTTTLNAPANVNPGNLGAVMSSAKDMGVVLVKRGHRAQNLPGTSILRYYNISPANNSGLGATLKFNYLEAELNGLPENKLVQWRSPDGLNWVEQGLSSNDATQNYVEKTGIDAFSVWTLALATGALPVVFTDLRSQCEGDRVVLRWKTAQESNSSHFTIERNSGTGWGSIGSVPAAGYSSTEKSYALTDLNPVEQAHYRIAQYDQDGRVSYTPVVVANCTMVNTWQVWPNPFTQAFTVRVYSDRNDRARIRVMDAKGGEISNRSFNLLRGLNQLEVNMQQAAAGVYLLLVEWTDGRPVKTMRLVKQ